MLDVQITTTKRTKRQRARTAQQVFKDYADRILTRAEELVPVDTGALHRSLHHEIYPDGFAIIAGTGLPDARARYQEFGFHHVKTGQFIQNPYIRPAIEQYKRAFVADFVSALLGATDL